MNSRCALVSKIIPFSCVDGPGSRLALFLQGCNLHCKNCHNPWTMGRCNDCGDAIIITAAAGVAEFAAYHRWLGRHERCDEIDRLRDEAQAMADRRAASEGRVAL